MLVCSVAGRAWGAHQTDGIHMTTRHALLLVAGCVPLLGALAPARGEVRVNPLAVRLDRPEASQQLLVIERQGIVLRDVTRQAQFVVESPAIVRVDADGLVHPLAEGNTQIVARVNGGESRIPVTVTGLRQPAPVSFSQEIIPILTKGRCNA